MTDATPIRDFITFMRALATVTFVVFGISTAAGACGSSDPEPSSLDGGTGPGGGDASATTDGSGSRDATTGGASSCVAAGGSCVCFSPCSGDSHNEPALVTSCAAPAGAPGCAEQYCCVPGAADAGPDGGACNVAGATCCDPAPGDGPNFCSGGLQCCPDNTCGVICS